MYLYPLAAASPDRAKEFYYRFFKGTPAVNDTSYCDSRRPRVSSCLLGLLRSECPRSRPTDRWAHGTDRLGKRVTDPRAVARNNGRLHSYRVSLAPPSNSLCRVAPSDAQACRKTPPPLRARWRPCPASANGALDPLVTSERETSSGPGPRGEAGRRATSSASMPKRPSAAGACARS